MNHLNQVYVFDSFLDLAILWVRECYDLRSWQCLYRGKIGAIRMEMEPCGISNIISDHELYASFNFTLCFRLGKC